jgi:hypothetical protein
MSRTKGISGALAALAMSSMILGACVSPGAGLAGSPSRDSDKLESVAQTRACGDLPRSVSHCTLVRSADETIGHNAGGPVLGQRVQRR